MSSRRFHKRIKSIKHKARSGNGRGEEKYHFALFHVKLNYFQIFFSNLNI
jgi:hypothetical protein